MGDHIIQRTQINPTLLTDTKVAGFKAQANAYEVRDAKVQGLRLRVGSTGRKTWYLKARVGNAVMNKKLGAYPGTGLAAAREAAIATLETTARTGSAAAMDRTFGELSTAWVDKIKAKGNRSWKLASRRLEMHVLPKWKDRKLTDIRRRDVRELIEGLEGEVLPNRVLTTIRTVFRFGMANDWLEASPAEGIEKPKEDKARDRVLDMAEVARVWKAAEHLGFPFTQFVRTLLLTAQRRTEVASMVQGSVDLEAGIWTLSAEETKARRRHIVPLCKPCVALLSAMPKFGDKFMFTTDGKTHMSGFAKLKQRLDEFIEADGQGPMAPWTFHDLRRSAATAMVRLGCSVETAGRVLNHAPQGVTAKVYALHQFEAEQRDALERWAKEVMRAVDGDKVGKLRPIK